MKFGSGMFIAIAVVCAAFAVNSAITTHVMTSKAEVPDRVGVMVNPDRLRDNRQSYNQHNPPPAIAPVERKTSSLRH